MTTSIPWAQDQRDVFDAVASSRANLLINAVAGGGKTTTIVGALDHVPRGSSLLAPSVAFLAFNRNIAEALKTRVPRHVQCSTFHAFGLRALKRALPEAATRRRDFVDGRKVAKLVFRKYDRDSSDVGNVIRLVGLLKSTWPKEEPCALALLHDLDFEEPEKAFSVAEEAYEKSLSQLDTVDFDDMLLLPVALDLPLDPQDWIFVDESQDTNNIQLELLERMQKPGQAILDGLSIIGRSPSPTRLVFVGDPHQAIYGFRGANGDSMEVIAKRFQTTSLPLSVSYRCPKRVVEEARKYITSA